MCYSLWHNAPTMLLAGGRQHRRCIIPQAVTRSLVLLKISKIIAQKNVELTGIINKPLSLHLVGCLYYLYVLIIFTCSLELHCLPHYEAHFTENDSFTLVLNIFSVTSTCQTLH